MGSGLSADLIPAFLQSWKRRLFVARQGTQLVEYHESETGVDKSKIIE